MCSFNRKYQVDSALQCRLVLRIGVCGLKHAGSKRSTHRVCPCDAATGIFPCPLYLCMVAPFRVRFVSFHSYLWPVHGKRGTSLGTVRCAALKSLLHSRRAAVAQEWRRRVMAALVFSVSAGWSPSDCSALCVWRAQRSGKPSRCAVPWAARSAPMAAQPRSATSGCGMLVGSWCNLTGRAVAWWSAHDLGSRHPTVRSS